MFTNDYLMYLSPGAIETPMLDKAGLTVDFVREVVGPTLPRGRIGKVADTTAAHSFCRLRGCRVHFWIKH